MNQFKMTRIIIAILYLILTTIIIAYIDNGIRTHNMSFYYGKDNGYFTRFESIIILNTVFFFLMTIKKNQSVKEYLKQSLLGFVTALIFGLVCYFIFLSSDYYGLTYHVATIIVCYFSYFLLKGMKLMLARVLKKTN
ncbi:MAG: hypothetical protein CMP76_04265 [Flavobacterium sp.]|nr:hypothetical protein [Flavobacterium sp.]